MIVRFWGTRGSLPASMSAHMVRSKILAALQVAAAEGIGPDADLEAFIDDRLPFSERATYGTNTSCVEIRDGDSFILCDAGSGLRDFGNYVMGLHPDERPHDFHLLLSHLHWDHIQGFPFFVPALIPGNRITIYGCHEELEKALSIQQSLPFFPLPFQNLGAEVGFVHLTPGRETEIAGYRVTSKQQNHPGRSYGFRLERNGKSVVYSTDAEHKNENEEDMSPFTRFFNGADMVVFDAQYTFADACTVKQDWGHSNNLIGVEMALKAGVRHLILFHQDPGHSDRELDRLLEDTRKLVRLLMKDKDLVVSIAYDGMVVNV